MKIKKKTRKAISKRISISKKGKRVKRKQAFVSHLALGKSAKQKRHLQKSTVLAKSDYKRWRKLIG